MRRRLVASILLIALRFVVPSTWADTLPKPADDEPSDVATVWFDTLYEMVKSEATAFPDNPKSAFYADALEVYDTGLALTDEQRAIAQYWANGVGATGTSSGRWMAVVGQIARNESLSLAAGEAYAKCGIAVVDAFITIFHAKYVYNLQHPLTYIQNHIDKIWLPYLVHPPNPLYSSRHSIQSRAAAEVLTDLFGHKAFTDTLQTDYNLMPPPRTARVQLV